jgi:hypothetical protein
MVDDNTLYKIFSNEERAAEPWGGVPQEEILAWMSDHLKGMIDKLVLSAFSLTPCQTTLKVGDHEYSDPSILVRLVCTCGKRTHFLINGSTESTKEKILHLCSVCLKLDEHECKIY